MNEPSRLIEILLVEDSETDRLIAIEAFKASRFPNRLNLAVDGVEALAFLRREGKYSEAPVPDLVLLDLNMPRKGGFEVLAEMKAEAGLKIIPVVVLSTSRDEGDVLKAYQLNANCYICKPFEFDRFVEVIKAVESYWFTIVTLPARPD